MKEKNTGLNIIILIQMVIILLKEVRKEINHLKI